MKQASSRWSEVNRILEGAMDLSPDQAARFIETACEGDVLLQEEVTTLWREMNDDEPEHELPMSRSLSRMFERSARQDRDEETPEEQPQREANAEETTERRQWFFPFVQGSLLTYT